MLVFSTINFVYHVSVYPFDSKKQNIIELFNELNIMVCCHLYNIFLRGEGSIDFINTIGWVFMGLTGINIVGNLSVVLFETMIDSVQKVVDFRKSRNHEKII